MTFKLIHMLAEKLIDEKLEPISIKIDCDKNKYPDIITSLKDPNDLIENKDNVYFTPNFLPIFDIKGISDISYLKLLCKFNAVQLGFKLYNYLSGRFDPKNKKIYEKT